MSDDSITIPPPKRPLVRRFFHMGKPVSPEVEDLQPLCEEDLTLCEEDITLSYLMRAYTLVQNAQGAQRERNDKYAQLINLAVLSARLFCEAVDTDTSKTDYQRMGKDLDTGYHAAITVLDYRPPALSDQELRRLVPVLVPMLRAPVYEDLRPRALSDLVSPLTKELVAPLEEYTFDQVFENLDKLVEPLVPLLQAPLVHELSPPLVRTMQVVLHQQLLKSLLEPLTTAVLARIPRVPGPSSLLASGRPDENEENVSARAPKRSRSHRALPAASGSLETGRG